MTSPQQQEQQPSPAEDAVIAALAVFFASVLAIKALHLPRVLVARLESLGLATKAIKAAGDMAMEPPLTGRGRFGSPPPDGASASRAPSSPSSPPATSTVRTVKSEEPEMRARFVVAASKRLTRAITLGVYPEALRVEPTYLKQHRAAGRNRLKAAQALDLVAAAHGPWLVWRTKGDSRVDAHCAALEGRLFTIDNLPNGGDIPGAIHVACRCWAAPAF
jgi:hypothetical protein